MEVGWRAQDGVGFLRPQLTHLLAPTQPKWPKNPNSSRLSLNRCPAWPTSPLDAVLPGLALEPRLLRTSIPPPCTFARLEVRLPSLSKTTNPKKFSFLKNTFGRLVNWLMRLPALSRETPFEMDFHPNSQSRFSQQKHKRTVKNTCGVGDGRLEVGYVKAKRAGNLGVTWSGRLTWNGCLLKKKLHRPLSPGDDLHSVAVARGWP